jgi:hypothetical protein
MVEEATAATRNLAQQSDELNAIVSSFVTSAHAALSEARREPGRTAGRSVPHKPAPMAAARPAPRKLAASGNTQGWEEF